MESPTEVLEQSAMSSSDNNKSSSGVEEVVVVGISKNQSEKLANVEEKRDVKSLAVLYSNQLLFQNKLDHIRNKQGGDIVKYKRENIQLRLQLDKLYNIRIQYDNLSNEMQVSLSLSLSLSVSFFQWSFF